MEKSIKKMCIFMMALVFVLIPVIVNAVTQPEIEREIIGGLSESENIIEKLPDELSDMKFSGKAEVIDNNGKKQKINYKAIHKLKGKRVENGQTIYRIQSQISAPVKVKTKEKQNIVQRIFGSSPAYATIDFGQDSAVYSVMTAYTYAEWDVIPHDGIEYCKPVLNKSWWERDRANLQVYDAYLYTRMQGNTIVEPHIGVTYAIPDGYPNYFDPSWNTTYKTNNYYINSSSYSSWPYIQPVNLNENHQSGSISDIWDAYDKVATINTMVVIQ